MYYCYVAFLACFSFSPLSLLPVIFPIYSHFLSSPLFPSINCPILLPLLPSFLNIPLPSLLHISSLPFFIFLSLPFLVISLPSMTPFTSPSNSPFPHLPPIALTTLPQFPINNSPFATLLPKFFPLLTNPFLIISSPINISLLFFLISPSFTPISPLTLPPPLSPQAVPSLLPQVPVLFLRVPAVASLAAGTQHSLHWLLPLGWAEFGGEEDNREVVEAKKI